MPLGAVAPDLWDRAVSLKSALSSLRSRNLADSIVPDGVIPHAAIEFLKLLGVPGSQQNMHLKCCNSISRKTGQSEVYIFLYRVGTLPGHDAGQWAI